MAKKKKEVLKGREVSQSVPILISDQVHDVFDALKDDVKRHPMMLTDDGEEISGIDAVAYRIGMSPKTIRSKWNPGKDRTIKLDELVEWCYACPLTNTINALITSLYMFSRKNEEELKRIHRKTQQKLDKVLSEIGAMK